MVLTLGRLSADTDWITGRSLIGPSFQGIANCSGIAFPCPQHEQTLRTKNTHSPSLTGRSRVDGRQAGQIVPSDLGMGEAPDVMRRWAPRAASDAQVRLEYFQQSRLVVKGRP